jgi:hypothetical protein
MAQIKDITHSRHNQKKSAEYHAQVAGARFMEPKTTAKPSTTVEEPDVVEIVAVSKGK